MRTVGNLSRMDGRIFVYLRNETVRKKFLQDAENEGFTFGDGVLPAQRSGNDLYAIHRNYTMNYVGFIGHMAFRNPQNVVGNPLIRIDYEKYVLGFDDYVM